MGNNEKIIDRWPAWFIAAYACITIGLHTGILNCGALFYPALMETFNQPISVVSWLVTGQYSVAFCFSPLYNRLIDYIPNRIAITVAVLLTTGSMIGSSAVCNFWAFLSLYTVLAGIGMGVSVVRAISTAAEYFDRYRILALALCSGGSGLGTFIYSKIGAYMIERYTWRIALVGYGLLHLHVIVMGILLKPLPLEPVPEPTVVITEHPDLSSSELPADLLQHKTEPGQNLFLSIMSVNSISAGANAGRGGSAVRLRTDLSRRNTIASDLRIVIEFVKATRSTTDVQQIVYLDPISFLSDPGSRVLKQLENAAQDALLEGDTTTKPNQVMIPILFIVSDFDVIQVDTHDPIVGSQLKVFLDSRFDLSGSVGRPDETATQVVQTRPVHLGDSFASSMVILQDRRRIRQTIRAVISRGQNKVEMIADELRKRGQCVYPTPVVALVDQNVDEPGAAKAPTGTAADHGYLWSNLALDNYVIPEEIEPEHDEEGAADFDEVRQKSPTEPLNTGRTTTRPDRDRTRPVRRSSQLHGSQSIVDNRPYVWTGRVKRSSSVTRPFESVMIQSGTDLPQSKVPGAPSYDIFASIISIDTPHEAAEVLESKYFEEMKTSGMTADLLEMEKPERFLLANMTFFTFLLTRLLVFIADSIVFAHLSNFAIISGFDPDAAAGLLSFIGIANMLGRIGTGVVGQFAPKMELRSLTAVCLLVLSVYMIIMPLFPTYAALASFAVSYGLLVSPSFAFAPTIAYDVVGPSRYDQAIAFVFQFEAIGYLVGGPIGGAIKEVNNDYFECFLFAGSNELIASAILFVQAFIIHNLLGKIFIRCSEKQTV